MNVQELRQMCIVTRETMLQKLERPQDIETRELLDAIKYFRHETQPDETLRKLNQEIADKAENILFERLNRQNL